IEVVDRAPPGAHAAIGREQLERNEYDDIHKALAGITGVYFRDEDGYGLRPNIGMRGAAADRSAKITLMEDGVLIAPAPYTAPAAYYAPLTTRLSRIEVTKGPAAILFGPNTVGGAVDMRGEPMPGERAGYVDVAGGSNRYGKLHARAAERARRWGVMGEYVHLRTDGFKVLDNGGPTGFAKNDASLTALVTSDPTAAIYHRLELRGGYGDETSHETYTGLTDGDFATTPQRRYSGSQLDEMNWRHWRLRATHRVDLDPRTRLETTAYRNRFTRAWGKVDGFVGQRDFYGLLARPMAGANQIYYAILTGQQDTSAPEEELILGTNDRKFASQGIQSAFTTERHHGNVAHHVDLGARIHFDRADRKRYEDTYAMTGGTLVRAARPRSTVIDSRAETLALATYAQDRVHWKQLEISAGLRVEAISYRFKDWLTDTATEEDSYTVVVPGGGVLYHVTDELSVLAGVHRGFVPVAPSAAAGVLPESSINYEAGGRWRSTYLSFDAIGFFGDYSNLKGSCTLASGCMEVQDGQEFNGGAVHVFGAELQGAVAIPLTKRVALPIEVAYTETRASFQHGFESDFPGWGTVEAGDELPYLPRHQLSVSTTLATQHWDVGTLVRWRSESRDVAGQGVIPVAERADALLTVDLSAHVRIRPEAELYLTINNLLDEQVIVSRRPYGARPNSPRMIQIGYKGRF
ncbi:MAG: TonB-dependent receptor, partial [Deltaproteobacteria bacterium]|nr:TonB-dependent receptor [Deltaproteobacteria bacterium]